ncbi:ABC transporter substrate-binding protein [Devosia salina]|uniref:Sugar ABC transporter substrate-binding protein n=1 Tax=Devosia salina TaxID=2860336 RepID=A0ABX8WFX1_9HYPH|nr:sugar ABC transporter substrate-binding protein [Devosia salina]QYO77636.1 sugar ABC transporter substrate-binding protein [Devosia salina]
MSKTIQLLAGIAAVALLATPVWAQQTTVKYMTFSAAPNYIAQLEETIAAFEAQHPDINVEYETAAFGDYFTKLQTLVASRSLPDTFELNYENFVTYAERNALLDLNPLIEADEGFDVGIYNPTALSAFALDGKQYGLVESFSNVVLYYNKDLFDAAGVDYPTADWTWEDELAAAQALTKADAGVWGTFSPIQFWEFYKTIAQNGGAVLNADKTEVTLASPENIEALTWMVDKVNTYKVTPSDAEMGGQSPEDLFKAGKIAMLRTGIWMLGAFADAPFAWDIALEPGKTQKAHHFFANGVAVSAQTQNAEAAYEWIKFLTASKEAVEIRIAAGWELPAVTDEAALEGYLAQPTPESREVVFEALDTAVVPPVIGNWNQLTDAVGKELDEAKLGRKTPEQALTDAAAIVQGLL